MNNKNDIRGIDTKLEEFLTTEFGEYYVELIELEFDCTLDEFITWFIECDEEGCYYTNI